MRARPTAGTTAATAARPAGLSRGRAAAHMAMATPAGPGPADQRRWPGPPYDPFDQLGQGPAGRAAGQKPARALTVVSQQRRGGGRGHGSERTELHDGPHRTVERIGQSVDRQEGPGLALPDLIPARR